VLVSSPVVIQFRCNADHGSFVVQLAQGPMTTTIPNGLCSMDADVDHMDPYFDRAPRHPRLAMHPIHADAQKDEVVGVPRPSSLSFVSCATISPVLCAHLNCPNFATVARLPTNKTAMNGSHINRTSSAGYEDAAHDNGGCSFSVFDPLHKLHLHAVPLPDLDAPSPLELPPGTASAKAAAGGLRKIWMGLVPLAEPASCYQDDDWRGTLFGADEDVIPPSLSRS